MADPEKQYHHRQEPFLRRASRILRFNSPETGGRNRRASSFNTLDKVFLEKSALAPISESADAATINAAKEKADIDNLSAIRADNLDRRRHVRTLPPWIHSLQEDEKQLLVGREDPTADPLSKPPTAKAPQRNHVPAPKLEAKPDAARGRAWDHARSDEAVTMPLPHSDFRSKWQEFVGSSSYAQPKNEEGMIVDDDWINQNVPDLTQPYISTRHTSDSEKSDRLWLLSDSKRIATFKHLQTIVLRNPFVPLLIRLTVMAFVVAALALGVQIYKRSMFLNNSPAKRKYTTPDVNTRGDYICKQQASTYMAFAIDSVAVIYLFYITYDEYFSKPLGLRSSKDKMRLLFLDLLFIVFSAANLSLAFNTLTDEQWSCFDVIPGTKNLNNAEAAKSTCVTDAKLCSKQKALVSVLLIAEIAWIMTFGISTMRVVERISR